MPRLHAPVFLPAGRGTGFGGAVFLGLFVTLALLACFKYLALHSTVSGLGLLLSDLYSIHTVNHWWRAFTDHARPLLPLVAQVYRLVPDQAAPFVLLSFQALILALPALWMGRRYGLLAALAYALFFPVWAAGLSDFHLEPLLVPILFGFLAAARSGRTGLAAWLGLLPALVGEYHALTTAACGVYLLAVHQRRLGGWLLILAGGAVYFVATYWLIPFCSAAGQAGLASPWLVGGPGLAARAGQAESWGTLGACFGALLLFPLFRPWLLLPALPSLALAFFPGPGAAGWTSPVLVGAVGPLLFAFGEVLGPVRVLTRQSGIGPRRFGLTVFLALALGHVLLAPSPASRLFLAGDSFSFGADAYAPTARDAAILAEILRFVPDDDKVAVVSQNTLNWGALAERRRFGAFPRGVFEPQPVRDLSRATWEDFWAFVRSGRKTVPLTGAWRAQYVLLDTTRPWCLSARDGHAQGGECQDRDGARMHAALVAQVRQDMEPVYDQGGFVILRRRPEPAPPEPEPAADPAPTPGTEAGPPAQAPPPGSPQP